MWFNNIFGKTTEASATMPVETSMHKRLIADTLGTTRVNVLRRAVQKGTRFIVGKVAGNKLHEHDKLFSTCTMALSGLLTYASYIMEEQIYQQAIADARAEGEHANEAGKYLPDSLYYLKLAQEGLMYATSDDAIDAANPWEIITQYMDKDQKDLLKETVSMLKKEDEKSGYKMTINNDDKPMSNRAKRKQENRIKAQAAKNMNIHI